MPEKGFFALRLKELRQNAGLSQPQLSDKSGVAVSTIRQFEYGRREPTYETLLKLAQGLGVSLAAFDQAVPVSQVTNSDPMEALLAGKKSETKKPSEDTSSSKQKGQSPPRGRPRKAEGDKPKKGKGAK